MHSHDRMFVYVVVCTHVGKTFLHFFSLLSNLCLQVYFKNLQNVSLSKLVFFGGEKGKRRSEKKKEERKQGEDKARASRRLELERAGVLSPSPSPSEKLYFIYKL